MKTMISACLVAAAMGGAHVTANAATRTVTLALPSMNCEVCPLTVKKALTKVPGVSQASVNYEKRQAVVTFDDAKTNPGALTESTKNAGYPSTVAGAIH